MIRNCRALGLATILGISISGAAEAQQLEVAFQRQVWGTETLRPLNGGQIRFAWPDGFELSFEHGVAGWGEHGSTCAGLIIDPSDCVVEPLAVRSTMVGFAVGASIGEWNVLGGELAITPSGGLVVAHFGRKGRVTGGAISDGMVLAELGLAGRYRTAPLLWRRVGAFVEGRVAIGKNLSDDRCVDCFDVLNDDESRRSVSLGLSIGP